jgi:hypothetical protein
LAEEVFDVRKVNSVILSAMSLPGVPVSRMIAALAAA